MPIGIGVNGHRLGCEAVHYTLRVTRRDLAASFGARLRSAREALSAREVAQGKAPVGVNEVGRRAKMGGGTYSRLESDARGKRPSADSVERLARVFDVHVRWLMSGTGPRELTDASPGRTPLELVLAEYPNLPDAVREHVEQIAIVHQSDVEVDVVRQIVAAESRKYIAKIEAEHPERILKNPRKESTAKPVPQSERAPRSKRATGTQ